MWSLTNGAVPAGLPGLVFERAGNGTCTIFAYHSRVTRTVYVVPHTHWDREWYQPFELFRWRLVQAIDEILDHMERHPEYRCFNLDGQSIVIADYLELRPENRRRLRRLIEQGRIVIGPWWVQPDEFLPSGESHIRNLQKGTWFARDLGGSLDIGHVADQFGHIAQLPQLFNQFGLRAACLWRGVPDSVPGWTFLWDGPDGTRVPVLYLRNSYSNGWRIPTDADELVERTRRQEDGRGVNEPLLLMNGTDHSRMERHVPSALANAQMRGYDFRMVTLGEYASAMFEYGVDPHVHQGELRSPDSSNVLPGVLSARVPIKQRDFAVNSFLERVAEPLELLAWLHGGPDGLPALKQAWNLVLENAPHDSICGCSIDQVHDEMMPRYDRAEQLSRQVAREAASYLVRKSAVPQGGGIAVFRPVPNAAAVVEVAVPARWRATALRMPDGRVIPVEYEGTREAPRVLQQEQVTPAGVLRHLDFLREGRYDAHVIEDFSWTIRKKKLEFVTTVGDAVNAVDQEMARREVQQAIDAGLADSAEVRVEQEDRRMMRFVLPPSESVGLELLAGVTLPKGKLPGEMSVTKKSIANSFYKIELTKAGLRLTDNRTGMVIDDFLQLTSAVERGDSYNAEVLKESVSGVDEIIETTGDSLSATMCVWFETFLPLPGVRKKGKKAGVEDRNIVRLRLWAGVPRVDVVADPPASLGSRRVRALVRLPFEVDSVLTENQFHVGKRSISAQEWNGASAEKPVATFPQKTFAAVEAGNLGLAVLNRGLPEGEVIRHPIGKGQAYAITLQRSFGMLSRNDLKGRRGGAGPMIETPGARNPGESLREFAITTYRGDWRSAGVQPMAHAYAIPPIAFSTNEHDGDRIPAYPLARIDDPRVVVSALHRSQRDGAPIARVYSSADEYLRAHIFVPAGSDGAGTTNLLEEHIEAIDREGDGWPVTLRPWEIRSIRFGRR